MTAAAPRRRSGRAGTSLRPAGGRAAFPVTGASPGPSLSLRCGSPDSGGDQAETILFVPTRIWTLVFVQRWFPGRRSHGGSVCEGGGEGPAIQLQRSGEGV